MSNQKSRIPDWVGDWTLIVGAVVVLAIFIHYGFSLFYPAPEYGDFCDQHEASIAVPYQGEINTEAQCQEVDGRWTEFDSPRPVPEGRVSDVGTTTITGHCDVDYYCRQDYQAAADDHSRNAFLAIVVIGVVVAAIGFSGITTGILATTFSLGGVIVLLTGTARFWRAADNYLQFILLALALVVFIYFAWRRSED